MTQRHWLVGWRTREQGRWTRGYCKGLGRGGQGLSPVKATCGGEDSSENKLQRRGPRGCFGAWEKGQQLGKRPGGEVRKGGQGVE